MRARIKEKLSKIGKWADTNVARIDLALCVLIIVDITIHVL